MEQHKTLDYDSDIIICEDIPETILVSASPEKITKPKKKCKRKVKKGTNHYNNMETLLITQNLKVKKTKFKCIININTIGSGSIERFHTNVCKKEAYYKRILPVCLRKMCSGAVSCCRSTRNRDYKKHSHHKALSLPPVSSPSLSAVYPRNNISYEDISNGSFSSDFEEELDTLIKRTKQNASSGTALAPLPPGTRHDMITEQREKQIDNLHPRKHRTSTPTYKDDIASPLSIDTDKKSIHSDNTMILHPLTTEAYSPTSLLEGYNMDPLEIDNPTKDMIDIDVPYSPTMTPDLIKIENFDYLPVDRTNDDIPYSPTYTPESNDIEIMNNSLDANLTEVDMDVAYSPTFTPDILEMEFNNNKEHGNELYSPTQTMEMEDSNSAGRTNAQQILGCSARFTVTSNFHKLTQLDYSSDHNDLSRIIKQEESEESTIIRNMTAPDLDILTPKLLKNEKKDRHNVSDRTDYNINNTINSKSKTDKRGLNDNAIPSEVNIKIEKNEQNFEQVHSTVFKNNTNIKTEVKHEKI